jgi:hypothetical protein
MKGETVYTSLSTVDSKCRHFLSSRSSVARSFLFLSHNLEITIFPGFKII